jgi:purine-binding chemotaxis protein CheW
VTEKHPHPAIGLMAFVDWVATSSEQTKPSEPVDPESLYVGVVLDRDECGLLVANLREILRVGEIQRVPDAPPHIRGLTNVRGAILPVVEVRTRLGLSPLVLGPAARIVVVEVRGRSVGLLVDRVTQIVKVRASQIEPASAMTPREPGCFSGVARCPGGPLFLLDPEKIVTSELERGAES